MRISDWSSDVCSSDLSTVNRVTINRYHNVAGATVVNRTVMQEARPVQHSVTQVSRQQYANLHPNRQPAIRPATAQAPHASAPGPRLEQTGRASWRDRVCPYVSISVVAESLKKKTRMNRAMTKENHS